MAYEFNFGAVRSRGLKPTPKKSGKFRLALLGDFSARANSGRLDTGDALAARKPLKVDCDNLDATLKRLGVKLRLPLGAGGAVEFAVNSLDDLHPDQLYSNLPIFSELSGLRQRLKTPSTFAKAAQEVQSWAGVKPVRPPRAPARSAAIPSQSGLSDFARLIGAPSAPPKSALSISELLKQAVGPYVVPAKDPKLDVLVSTVDSALAATMRSVLHHPDFQSFEALWRSVDMLVRRLETDENLQIVLLDVSAEELAADLSRTDGLENSGLFKLLVELPAQDAAQGTYSVIVGNYVFEQSVPHAELLGRLANIVAPSQSAFIAGVGPGCIEVAPKDLDPAVRAAWDALAARPESAYVGLVTPRFMLRNPYGEQTDLIDSFDFEEFTPQDGLRGMLWGNSAVAAGLLLGASFSQAGAQFQPGAVLTLGEMPFYYFTDADGDQVALPCTERLLSSRLAERVQAHRFMPMISMKGTPEIRLGGFVSLADSKLAGPWAPVTKSSPPPVETAPEAPPPSAEAAPAVEATAAAPAGEPVEVGPSAPGSDPELDQLLASLGAEQPAPVAEAATAETAPAATEASAEPEPEMDPELAKLLKELG